MILPLAPDTHYARTADGLHIAYQVVGDGPLDLLFVPGYQSNLELNWDLPAYARMLRRLASFSKVIAVDRRGTGLSDRLSPGDHPPLEALADDLGTVLREVGSVQAALAGFLDGGYLCAFYAATNPAQTRALILYGTSASGMWSPDYPWQWKPARWNAFIDKMLAGWGKQEYADEMLRWYAPNAYQDLATRRWWTRYQWLSASPSSAVALERIYSQTDLRQLLPTIRIPTLVMHRNEDPAEPVEGARYIASRIPGARYVELEGVDQPPWAGDSDSIVDEIQEFITGVRPVPDLERVLSTVLFTDIVSSTATAASLGDNRWKDLLAAHDQQAHALIEHHRGTYVESTGDGLLATFDGPARAVRCAQSMTEAVRSLGVEIRAGCHTGEIERDGPSVRGIAVHIGARVSALAGPSEILVSSTFKDLVAGSGLAFEDFGEHELRGVPEPWHIYRVVK